MHKDDWKKRIKRWVRLTQFMHERINKLHTRSLSHISFWSERVDYNKAAAGELLISCDASGAEQQRLPLIAAEGSKDMLG